MGFSLYFVVSSIDGWFGCVNSPFARILQKRGRYEKKRDCGSFNVTSSLQYFWKSEGDGKRREEERK